MKRYLLFGGDYYYPGGGWHDFQGDFDTLEEAVIAGKEIIPEKHYPASTFSKWEREAFTLPARTRWEWTQVVDTESGHIVSACETE